MAHYDSDLDIIVGNTHSLLDPIAPSYSNMTVRRAFIVWMHCGQQNKFKDVCNYYHKLEELEDAMTPEARAASRHHEFHLFSNRPPTSAYMKRLHPKLYPNSVIDPNYISKVESIKNDKCVFKLEGFNKYRNPDATNKDVHDTSRLVRHYCQTRYMSPRKFLKEFQNYIKETELEPTVQNMANYIKLKTEEAEKTLINNFPPSFSFLEDSDDDEDIEEVPAPKKEVKSDNNILKLLLRIKEEGNMKKDFIIAKTNTSRSDTCAQFFNLFKKNRLHCNNYSLADVPLSFEDFAKVLYQNSSRFGSVQNLVRSNNELMNFGHNQYLNDSRLNAMEKIQLNINNYKF